MGRQKFFGPHDLSTEKGRAAQLELARRGGLTSHDANHFGHEFTSEEASAAARKNLLTAKRNARGRFISNGTSTPSS